MHVDVDGYVGKVVIRSVTPLVNTNVVEGVDIEVAVEVISDVDSCGVR